MSLQQLESIVSASLYHEKTPTPASIRQTIADVRALLRIEVTDVEAERLARTFEVRLDVAMSIGSKLVEQGYEPWLPARRASIEPFFWERYRKLLIQQRFPPGVLQTLDQVTDNVVGLLEDPEKDGEWDRRGMVVGHVQSGKTANYTGVVCKAADAGYKLIIVIAGVHNNLRSQTQARIDEGFIGRDTGKGMAIDGQDNLIGVGRFDATRKPASFTNTLRDFNKQQASSVGVSIGDLKQPAILVIKKNSNTLGNLIAWLKDNNAKRGGGRIADPMLLIDDEADNASINTAKGPGEVTKINGQIRTLLELFARRCYVGYTATPFANIFIDPDSDEEMLGADLFPRDFIVSLDPPDNYFGAKRVFLEGSDGVIRPIADNEDLLPLVHRIDHRIVGLPETLVIAIRAFVLSRGIRILRGHGSAHASMLVNVSRFTAVQSQLRNAIHAQVSRMRDAIRAYGGLEPEKAVADPEIRALKEVWAAEYADSAVWGDIQQKLREAVSSINVVEINARSKGGLDYRANEKSGLHVIAVGGFSLSRGLTLEGLTVSYFLRNSLMYDTLMQMGRWFGYRPGYEDLCRVWMPEEAQGWYEHIAVAIEELRAEFKAMEAVGATPREFGLKVRSHPDTLIVTARNKIGTGRKVVLQIGLGNSFVETASLNASRDAIATNRKAAAIFSKRLRALGHDARFAESVAGGFLLRDVPHEPIVEFVRSFRNSEASLLTNPGPLAQYIDERTDGELARWDVLIASVKADEDKKPDTSTFGRLIHCQQRRIGDRSNEQVIRVSNKQRVASRGIERTGLDADTVAAAEAAYLSGHSDVRKRVEKGEAPNFPDLIYRVVRPRPLLIVHLLDLLPAKGKERPGWLPEGPVVAWSISFPGTKKPENRVEYVVGAVWMEQNMPNNDADDDSGGDDGE
ncbi:MAG: Z1 domain-containing protein [Rhodocyclaceae bacterium]|nr:Z1 domain-containing protein [Rhodocyclaceae bacterium]